jgi:UDP-N-acetylglucosamine diphosphorylase/glucosamine-1-phosphate N-acetyltransferase
VREPALAAVIMAAGQGKRMQDPSKPKVLYPLSGQPLVAYVLRLTEQLGCQPTIVIIGFGRDQVQDYLANEFPSVETVIQAEQLGTGHAVLQTEASLNAFDGDVLVLSGDVPLLSLQTVRELVRTHRTMHAKATVLTVSLDDPHGYGRVIRSQDGASLMKIVEERDASPKEKMIAEINSGIYVFDASALFSSLKTLKRENVQGEYYLTDVFEEILSRFGQGSIAIQTTSDPFEVAGVNTKDQLLALEEVFLSRVPRI